MMSKTKTKIPQIVKKIQNSKPNEINYSYQKGISFSQLSLYLNCPKQWDLLYKQKQKVFTSTINTVFGTALHSTIQNYLTVFYEKNGTEADQIDLLEYFEDRFREEYQKQYGKNKNTHFSNSEEMSEFYEDAVEILNFIKKHRNKYFSKRGWHLVGCEIPIVIAPNKTHKNVLFNGFIDLVLYNESLDEFFIIDLKTSRSSWSDKQKKDKTKQFQILLYKQFFSEQFGVDIDKINIKFIILKRKLWEKSDFPQKRIQEISPPAGKTSLNKAKTALNEFINKVFDIDGSFKETEHKHNASKETCRWCPFRDKKDLCSEGIS